MRIKFRISFALPLRRHAISGGGAVNGAELGGVDPGMFFGSVARDAEPDDGGDDAEDGGGVEGFAPAVFEHDPADERRSKRATETATGEGEAAGEAAVFDVHPGGDGAVEIGPGGSFASAHEEAHSDERVDGGDYFRWDEVGGAGGQCGESGPPDDGGGEDFAGAEAITEPAAGELEQAVGEDEGAEDFPHLDIGEAVGGGDVAGGDGDVDAVEVGDHAEADHEAEEEPADNRWPVSRLAGRSATF